MKVARTWLNDWVDLKGVDFKSVIEQLSLRGLEVASLKELADDHVVVGRIDEIVDHPNSDKLVICKVDVGDGRLRQIGCGAKNMKAGDLVPVALPGAKPPGLDFEISSRPLAGIESEGMLCAEEELGLETSSEGLWILNPDLPLGMPALKATELEDTVVEIELTPNRPDALSARGVAREVGAIVGRPIRESAPYFEAAEVGATARRLAIEDADGCPNYVLSEISGVKVEEAPAWLRRRLASIGTRSINNVVDLTNYILMDLGQPLHAFDAAKVSGSLCVRRAKAGETLEGIDHKIHKLIEDDLVIADENGPVAIAGVMGGAATEVSETTTDILLECAYFDPTTVRKTARRLGLHTESSHRFERGIDRGQTLEHAMAAEALLRQISPSCAVKGRTQICAKEVKPLAVELTLDLVHRTLGLELEISEVSSLLASIGLHSKVDGSRLEVSVPSFRPDIERPIDLVEEVARLHGFDKLLPTRSEVQMGYVHRLKPGKSATIVPKAKLARERTTRSVLLAKGFAETLGYSFHGAEQGVFLGASKSDVLANALAPELSVMRQSLIPSLLKTLGVNIAQRAESLALFEFGRVYLEPERQRLGILVYGARQSHFSGQVPWDFFDLKGLVQEITHGLVDHGEWRVPTQVHESLHPGVQAEWLVDDKVMGLVGQVHPTLASQYDAKGPVFVAELEWSWIAEGLGDVPQHRPISKFPAVSRDFAIIGLTERPFSEIEELIGELRQGDRAFGAVFQEMSLFDVYSGAPIPEGKRSLAVTLTYRSSERTLTDVEIQAADQAFLGAIHSRGYELR